MIALFMKTKNFHWRMSGPHFRSDMLAELRDDNLQLAAYLRETHGISEEYGDVASASLLENWIDEAEQRFWCLFEASRQAEAPGPA
jgi:DNA-binding ferritin-like protein